MTVLDNQKHIIGVIPARYESTRFPGKPLADIGGKPMIQWVYENASRAFLPKQIMVATDDERILKITKSFGGNALMTPGDIASGTDRVAFIARKTDAEIFLNIQGDEPFIDPKEVDQVAQILIDDPSAVAGTLIKKISKVSELTNPNTAKVVIDENHNAIYFSRNPIPYCRDTHIESDWITQHIFYKQIGIYSYRKDFLLEYTQWAQSPLEKAEKLEQLRILEKGYSIKVAETQNEPVCVDTPDDLNRINDQLNRGLIST